MYLPLLIIGLALFPAGYALSCNQCDGKTSPPNKRCETSTPNVACTVANPRCAALSFDYWTGELTAQAVEVFYNQLTCLPFSQCMNFSSVGLGNLSIRMQGSCCNNANNCNTNVQLPTTTLGTKLPNGKKCYTCDPKSCKTTQIRYDCSTGEDYCMKLVYTIGGKSTTYKGCASKSACSSQPVFNTALNALVPGAGSSTKSTAYCCEGNFCNGAKNTAGSLLVLLAPVLLAFCSW